MVGVRTAVVVSLCAGLAWVAGQPQFARDMLTLDSSWKSRLQILVGRPAAGSSDSGASEARNEVALTAEATARRAEATARTGRDAERAEPQPREELPQVASKPPDSPSREQGRAEADVAPIQPRRVRTPESAPTPETTPMRSAAVAEVDSFLGEFVAIEGANLRSGPGQEHARIDVIGAGQRLTVTGRTRDQAWYQVRHRGRTLYIAATTVRAESIMTALGRLSIPELGDELEALERELKRARFQEVLSAARSLRLEVEGAARWTPLQDELVRLELLSATSEIALSRMEDASASLERALAVDSELELDPTRNPPKLRRLLDRVRQSL